MGLGRSSVQTRVVSKTKVPKHELLWEGERFSLVVPYESQGARVLWSESLGYEYLRLPYCPVSGGSKGGCVNRFLHPVKGQRVQTYLGRRVTVRVQIWRRTLPDGRQFLYINYLPIEDAQPTRELVVLPTAELPEHLRRDPKSEILTFPTPEPLRGLIVISSIAR